MSFTRDLYKLLFRPERYRPQTRHGRRVINAYVLRGEDDERAALMRAGLARSPEDASLLIRLYPGADAAQIIALAPRRQRVTFRQRLMRVIRRIDGHYAGDLIGRPRHQIADLKPQYRYRGKR